MSDPTFKEKTSETNKLKARQTKIKLNQSNITQYKHGTQNQQIVVDNSISCHVEHVCFKNNW